MKETRRLDVLAIIGAVLGIAVVLLFYLPSRGAGG